MWTSAVGLLGRGVKDGAVLADLQVHGRPCRLRSLPDSHRLPGLRTVSQLQVLGEAQLDLTDGLYLLPLKMGNGRHVRIHSWDNGHSCTTIMTLNPNNRRLRPGVWAPGTSSCLNAELGEGPKAPAVTPGPHPEALTPAWRLCVKHFHLGNLHSQRGSADTSTHVAPAS